MTVRLYIGEPRTIKVRYDIDPLSAYGFTFNDITEVTMNLKRNTANDNDDSYLEKLLSQQGVTVSNSGTDYAMIIRANDYDSIKVGNYSLVLAVSVNNQTPFIELEMEDSSVSIVPDRNRK